MATTAAVTNPRVGEAIGMTHSGVSRIRSGDRLPSFDAMTRIEAGLGWSHSDQAAARNAGKYAEEFEKALIRKFGAVNDELVVPSATA